MSVNDTDPALLFGGNWERIEGRFLLAASDKYEAGSTGGEAVHKLTVAEMPSHAHTTSSGISYTGSGNYNVIGASGYVINASVGSSYSGGSGAHNNMPPYLVVYMWQRVS